MNIPPPLPSCPNGVTADYPPPPQERSGRRPPLRHRVVLARSGGSAFRGAIEELLQRRLLFVALLTLFPSLIYIVRNLIDDDLPRHLSGFGLSLYAGVALLMASMAVLLWRRQHLSLSVLRVIELAIFGSLTAFFAWLQYRHFVHGPIVDASHCAWTPLILKHAVGSTSTRWFFLIIVYGVFIPNTWRRCLLVSVGLALTPLILTPWAVTRQGPPQRELYFALFDLALLMTVAVAIAVFGSHRIQSLEQRAFEARQLGQYRLKRRLGAGGMGEVYLAEHLLLRRPCAVKLIRPEQAGNPANLQRFEREVQVMATLTHWNSVEIYDYGHAEDGTFYYVMEYLPGHNLENLVSAHGALPPGRVIHLLRQVCAALREAHGIGLLHRDIKPSNILACERGGVFDVAKLLDFGLVQTAHLIDDGERITQLGAIVGSPPYMSPEQASGKSDLDARSDIYSLGAVAYFLLTGQAPFVRETAMLTLTAHIYETPPPPSKVRPDVPSDVEAVVLRCLAKKPEQRFADVQSLQRALADCAAADEWNQQRAERWWRESPMAVIGEQEARPDVPTQIAV